MTQPKDPNFLFHFILGGIFLHFKMKIWYALLHTFKSIKPSLVCTEIDLAWISHSWQCLVVVVVMVSSDFVEMVSAIDITTIEKCFNKL